MQSSYPSKKLTIADIAEVKNFNAEFFYNFFTKDETINDNKIEISGSYNIDSIEFDKTVPRYIKLNWQKISNVETEELSILENKTKINFEDKDFNFGPFTKLYVNLEEKNNSLKLLIEKAIENIIGISSGSESVSSVSKRINDSTSKSVTGFTLQNAIEDLNSFGIYFENQNSQKNISETVNLLINQKLLFDCVSRSTIETPLASFTSEQYLNNILEKQQNAANEHRSSLISSAEYDFQITNPISIVPLEINNQETLVKYIGYIIEKQEVLQNGSVVNHEDIVVNSIEKTNFIDVQIKYGSKYRYKIRTVAKIETQGIDSATNISGKISFLVGANPVYSSQIETKEYISPPPPVDFQIRWDYNLSSLILSWAFPPNNRQRDIKYFQIFRRENIEKPFELLALIDFNDSLFVQNLTENNINKDLIIKSNSPILTFIDKEFTKEKSFIYSICSVDAHGFSSNYSIQFQISFDKVFNKIIKKLISVSGASKVYPNMFLNTDTFVDTIKDEGHENVEVIFNPEYLQIVNKDNIDLNIIKTGLIETYKLQLTNLDLQAQQIINIKIEDRTT